MKKVIENKTKKLKNALKLVNENIIPFGTYLIHVEAFDLLSYDEFNELTKILNNLKITHEINESADMIFIKIDDLLEKENELKENYVDYVLNGLKELKECGFKYVVFKLDY